MQSVYVNHPIYIPIDFNVFKRFRVFLGGYGYKRAQKKKIKEQNTTCSAMYKKPKTHNSEEEEKILQVRNTTVMSTIIPIRIITVRNVISKCIENGIKQTM